MFGQDLGVEDVGVHLELPLALDGLFCVLSRHRGATLRLPTAGSILFAALGAVLFAAVRAPQQRLRFRRFLRVGCPRGGVERVGGLHRGGFRAPVGSSSRRVLEVVRLEALGLVRLGSLLLRELRLQKRQQLVRLQHHAGADAGDVAAKLADLVSLALRPRQVLPPRLPDDE